MPERPTTLDRIQRLVGMPGDWLAAHQLASQSNARDTARYWLDRRIEQGHLQHDDWTLAPLRALVKGAPTADDRQYWSPRWDALAVLLETGGTAEDIRALLSAPSTRAADIADHLARQKTTSPETLWALMDLENPPSALVSRLTTDSDCVVMEHEWHRMRRHVERTGGNMAALLINACQALPSGPVLKRAWMEIAAFGSFPALAVWNSRPGEIPLGPGDLALLCASSDSEIRLLALTATGVPTDQAPATPPPVSRPSREQPSRAGMRR